MGIITEGEWIEQLWWEYHHPEEAERRFREEMELFKVENS